MGMISYPLLLSSLHLTFFLILLTRHLVQRPIRRRALKVPSQKVTGVLGYHSPMRFVASSGIADALHNLPMFCQYVGLLLLRGQVGARCHLLVLMSIVFIT
jgi:hypothetical protein